MGDLFGSPLFIPALIVLAVIVAAVVLMGVGWRSRRRRQADLGPLPTPPAEFGEALQAEGGHSEDALYLATTQAEAPLDRIAIRGLGYRAEARVSIAASGILLELVGEPPLYIAASRLRGVGVATWTVDRGVERDGLVFVRWELGGTLVDSYLRSADSAALLAALDALVPQGSSPKGSSPKESGKS